MPIAWSTQNGPIQVKPIRITGGIPLSGHARAWSQGTMPTQQVSDHYGSDRFCDRASHKRSLEDARLSSRH
jgi:hypothetical protein